MKVRLIVIVFLLAAWGCSTIPGQFVKLGTGSEVTLDEILTEIVDERVIFVGEIHTNPSSHRVQYEVIKHLVESGKDVTIAIEIFAASKQKSLDRWVQGKVSRAQFGRAFNREVNLPFGAYEGIFEYARQMRIPIVGIDADRRLIVDVTKQGLKNVPEELRKMVKYTECSEEPQYVKMLGLSGNRDFHQSGMPFLCDGQRMRDSVMAYNISRIIQDNNSTVVVMLGLVHASKIAVHEMLQKNVPAGYVVLMPEKIKYITNKMPASDVADYIWY